jgi:hypothetical protein
MRLGSLADGYGWCACEDRNKSRRISAPDEIHELESVMIMMSRIDAEMRIRQRAFMEEMEREQAAEASKVTVVRVSGAPAVHSQFFWRRFGAIMSRLKIQPA